MASTTAIRTAMGLAMLTGAALGCAPADDDAPAPDGTSESGTDDTGTNMTGTNMTGTNMTGTNTTGTNTTAADTTATDTTATDTTAIDDTGTDRGDDAATMSTSGGDDRSTDSETITSTDSTDSTSGTTSATQSESSDSEDTGMPTCDDPTPWAEGANELWLASQTPDGSPHSLAGQPSLSADGQWLAYTTATTADGTATALRFLQVLDNACGNAVDVTLPEDAGPAELFSAKLSADGSLLAFVSVNASFVVDVWLHDLANDTLESINLDAEGDAVGSGNGLINISMSADGRYVVHSTDAPLVVGDDNADGDIFVRDRLLDTTTALSINPDGDTASGLSRTPVIAADGSIVVFESMANDIVAGTPAGATLFTYDMDAGTVEILAPELLEGVSANESGPSISGDGRYVAFQTTRTFADSDDNATLDAYVYDRELMVFEHISVDDGGIALDEPSFAPVVSGDGRWVVFNNGLIGIGSVSQLMAHDRMLGTTTLISVNADGDPAETFSALSPALTTDGGFVAFSSRAANLASPPLLGPAFNVYMTPTP